MFLYAFLNLGLKQVKTSYEPSTCLACNRPVFRPVQVTGRGLTVLACCVVFEIITSAKCLRLSVHIPTAQPAPSPPLPVCYVCTASVQQIVYVLGSTVPFSDTVMENTVFLWPRKRRPSKGQGLSDGSLCSQSAHSASCLFDWRFGC